MRFHTPLVFGLSVAILAACGGPATVEYRLTFDTQDPMSVDELTRATVRVAQRRLERMDAGVQEQSVTKDADGATLVLKVSRADAANTLTEEMSSPFRVDFMQATTASGADVTVEGMGGFVRTDVDGDDVVSVVAEPNAETGGARVRVKFTPEGHEQLRQLFAANIGKDIGLFVNGRLVSALKVQSAELPQNLIIDGIPDIEIAQIFADDVNVGLHVTVTPN